MFSFLLPGTKVDLLIIRLLTWFSTSRVRFAQQEDIRLTLVATQPQPEAEASYLAENEAHPRAVFLVLHLNLHLHAMLVLASCMAISSKLHSVLLPIQSDTFAREVRPR